MENIAIKKLLLSITCFFISYTSLYAQLVPVYSQYLVNQSIINPAYVGIDNCLNINALYRQQWTGYDGAPHTGTLSAHTPLRNRSLAVGFNMVNDVIGVTSNTLVEGQFAYRLRFGESAKLSFGTGVGLFVNKNNLASLKVNDAGDQVFSNNLNSTLPTFSFGSYFENKKVFVGLSSLNLTQNLLSSHNVIYQQPFYFTAGYHYKASETIVLTPSFLVKKVNNNPVNLDLNLFMDYGAKFRFGVSFRTKEALYAILQFKISEQLQLGYSYDYSLSVLRKYQNGSHEVSVKYIFKYKTNTVDVKSFE